MKTKLILPLLAAVLTLLVANPVRATILPPVMIGTNGIAALGTNLTITVTDVNGVSAGNVIIVTFTMTNKSGTVSCADSRGNSYSVDANFVNTNSAIRTVVLSASVTNALQQSDLITLTFPSVIPKAACAFYVSGLVAASRVDKTNSASGNSTAFNSGTITTTQTNELLIGAIGMQGTTVPTLTPGANYTALWPAYGSNSAPASHILTEFQIVTNTGSYAASGTTALSRLWLAGIVAYKGGSNQTINFPAPGNPTYGDAPMALNATASSGLPVTYAVLSGPATIVSSNQLTITGAGTVTIQAAQFGNATYSGTATNQTITVSPLPVQLTGTRAYDGTTEAAATDLTISNNLDGGNLTLTGSGTLSGKNVGTQSITNLGTPLRVSTSKGAVGSTPTNSFTVTIPTPQNGNTLIAVISTRLTSRIGVTNINQSGVTWTRTANSVSTSITETEIWYATNLTSAATNLTIQMTNAVFASAIVMEYQGLLAASPLDGAATLTNRSATALTGTNVTTQANELWIGGIGLTNSTLTLSAITNSFTLVTSNASSSVTPSSNALVYALERMVTATNAAYSGGAVSATAHWSGAIATFKAVALGLSGSAATNYTLAGLTGSLTVTGKVLTVTGLTATSRLYDGTTNVTLGGTASLLPAETIGTGTTSDGKFYVGDAVTLGGSVSGSFADKHVGTGKIVTVTGNTISGGDAGNYTLQPPAGLTANISATNLTVTATTNTKVYDRTTSATNTPVVTAGSIQGGDVANFTETYSSATVGVANRTLVPSGTVNDGNGGVNYNVAFVNFTTGTITAQALAVNGITANNKLYNGTTTTTITTNGYSFSGVLSPDVVVLATNGYTATFTNKNVGSGQPVTVTGLSLTGAQSGNYTLTNATFSTLADIIPTNITVTAVTNTKIYDRTTNAAATPIISPAGGIQPGDTANFTETYADATAGVTNKILIPAGVVNDGNNGTNYNVTLVNFNTGSITAKVLTVTGITAADKVYDRTNTATINLTNAVLNAGVISPDVVALVTNGAVGTFASSNVANNITVSISGLTLTGPAAANYAITAPTTTANITPKSVSVASGLTATSRLYNGTTTATITSNSVVMNGLVAPDTLTIRTNGYTAIFADRNVGSNKTVTVTGLTLLGSAVTNNYSLTQPTNLTANITVTNLGVTARTNTKVYDQTVSATNTPTVGNIQPGDTANFVEAYATATAGTGNKILVPSGSVNDGNGGVNYNVMFTNFTTGTISPKPLTMSGITVSNKVYDATTTAAINTSGAQLGAGVINPDVVALVTNGAAGAFLTAGVGVAKPVTITGNTLSGADAGNYSLTQQTGLTADITPALVTTLAGTRGYNGTVEAAAADLTIVNNQDGTNLTLTGSGTLSGENVGPQSIANTGIPVRVNVSTGSVGGTPTNSFTVTIPPPQNGNTLIAVISARLTSRTGVTNISQTGATWTRAAQSVSTNITETEIWYATNLTSAATSLTVKLTNAVFASAVVMEYQGLLAASPLDGAATLTNRSATALTGTNVTTQANELWIGGIGLTNSTLTLSAIANSFVTVTNMASGSGTASSNAVVYALEKMVTATNAAYSGGTVSATAYWSGAIATFKAAQPWVPLALAGSAATNYSLVGVSGTMMITGKVLTVTGLTASNKVYDATTNAAVSDTPALLSAEALGTGTTLDGKSYLGDVVNLTGATVGSFTNKNVGTNKPVLVAGLALIGADATNYSLPQPVLTANITPRPLSVTGITAADKIYDRTFAATIDMSFAALGPEWIFPDDVTLQLYGSGTFANSNVASGIVVTITNLLITGTDAGNYVITPTTTTASITKRDVSVNSGLTANNRLYNGTATATISSNNVRFLNMIIGDTNFVKLRTNGYAATFADKNFGSKTVTVTGLTLQGTAATNNYNLLQPTILPATISRTNLTVTARTNTKVYDQTTSATNTPTITFGSIQFGDTATNFTEAYADPAAGITNKILIPAGVVNDGFGGSNYIVTLVNFNTGTITARTLTLTNITAFPKVYDATTNAIIDASGAQIVELAAIYPDDVSLDSSGAAGAFATAGVGVAKPVTITGNVLVGADAGNYSLIQQTGLTADITPRPVTLTGTRIYNATTVAAAADLTFTNNLDGANLTLSGNGTLTAKDVGLRSITNGVAPVRVNFATGAVGGTATNSFNVTIPTPQNGNTLIAVISTRLTSANGVTNIIQNGALWTRSAKSVGTSVTATEIWYATNLTSAATNLTIKMTNAVFASAVVLEYQGLLTAAPLDGATTLTNRSVAALTGTNTPTQANELWIGGIGLTNSTFTLAAIQNSFVAVANVASGNATASSNAVVYALEKIVTATNAAYSGGTVSGGNVNWSGAIATFKAPQPWAPLALAGSAGSNYTLSGMSAVLKITHKALAVNGLIASNKWYDATTVASLGGTPTLLAAEPPGTGTTTDKTPYLGDAISVNASNAVGSFASANIGTSIPVSVSGCILTGADTNNYILNQPTNLAANITVGPASQLVFNQQPADTYSGWPMSTVTVQILDQYGNLTAGTTNIVLSIGNNPGGGALSGLRTNAAVNGTATFTNLSINKPGTNYTLLASATGLTAATSDTFNILPPSPDLPGALTNLVTISAGSLVVPMDNTNQAIGVPFNLKSYGLINQFLQNGIRVRWAIRTGKAKDAADFTAAAFRLKPTPSGVTNSVSFAGGPFIIDQTNAAAALGIITNWGKTSAGTNNNVAVFQLVSNTLVDIRHEIHFRPYVVVNTTLSPIDTDLLDYVGITNYTVTPDYTLSPDDCYSILMEPHQSSTNGVAAIKAFVEAGGNFLAQCASVDAYENAAAGNFQNSGALTVNNATGPSPAASMTFPNPDLPFSQCVGIIKTNIVGQVTEWTEGGVALNHAHTHASTSATNIMRATCSKHTIGLGGMVFYFGGHSYFKNITTGGDGAGDPVMTNDLAFINGVRMTLNTIFIPCGRRACDFVPTADLGITKTASNSVVVGQSLTYTITVTNQGPNGATNLVVTDTLPAGVSVLNTGGGINNGTNIIWTLSSLTNHAVAIYTLVVQAPISGYAFLTNTARVISDIDDPIYTNNTTPAVITAVIPSADLAIGKTAPGFVSATNNFDYTISVTNLGPSSASGVTVTDVFPADVSFVSASGNATLSDSGDSVTWDFGTLTNGQISTVTLTVTAPANGMLTNTASVGSLTTGDPNLTNNVTSGVISSVQTISDLAIGKTAPSTVYAASNLVYRISVTNFGPSSASSVTVTDILPVSATFVSALGNWTTNGNVVTWDLGTLSSGQVSNLTVRVIAPASGILTNVASVSAPTTDPNSTNNISLPVITSVIPLADVWVFKSSVSPSLVNLGDPVTYTIIASNAGPSTAFGVIVNDILPAGVALLSAPGSISTSGGVVIWPTVTLAAGDWTNYSLTLTAPTLYAFTNIAVVTNATTIDPHPTNNNGSSFISRAITQVVPVADLSVVLTGPTNVIETSNFVCSITISNAGPFASLDIAVADSLLTPLDYYYITASPLGTITFNPDFITWPSLPSLSAGSAVTYTFTLNALDTGWFTNIASAFSATTFDPNLTNNSGELSAAQLQTLVVVQFTTQVVTPTFNPQTGLYEERIWVANNSIIDAAALRIFATDLRPGVYLQNAYGVIAGQPYVLYNFPLPAGSSQSFLLEFLSVDYDTFTNGIRVEMLSTNYPPPAHDLWPAAPNRIFPQDPYPGLEPHLVNEFTTIPGRNYMILYGDTPVTVTNVSIPTIHANSSKTLWIDSGPPKTASDPVTTPVRFYRILLQP